MIASVLAAIDAGSRIGRGEQRTPDVAATNAHDAYHHEWDIRRTLESAPN
ncbi:hypothetical protein [Actinoallomurus sp. NPDC050550]